MNKSSMRSLFRSTNPSCESLTDRRQSSAENPELQAYLQSLQLLSDRKEFNKRMIKTQQVKKISPMRQSLFASNSVKELNHSTQQSSKQKPFARARFASQRSTILGKQAQLQEQYDEMNSEKLQLLNEALIKLVNQIQKLKEEINNNKKLYIKLQKLIGLKKNLIKLLLNLETQSLIEPLTVFHLKQNICTKEHIMEGTTLLTIDTYNFTIIRDINYLLDKIEELQIESEAYGIKQLEYKITEEIYNLKLEQNKLRHKRVKSPLLQFQQIIMRNQQFPDDMVHFH